MTPLWFAAPAILIAGMPFLLIALARVARDVHATHRSLTLLSTEIRTASDELRVTTRGFTAVVRTLEPPVLR